MPHSIGWLRRCGVWLLPLAAILVLVCPVATQAAETDFNIQVSPSPLALTLTPGQTHTATLTVRNLSTHSQTLVPRLQGFSIDEASDKIDLQSDAPLNLSEWIRFKQPQLTIPAGGSQPLDIIYSPPGNVGFSYSVAITLTAADQPTAGRGAQYQAAVAVFNLINIDRADATRQLQIEHFASDKARYEYLPARFSLRVKNTGNIISQPTGSIFIQRGFNDAAPLATIPLNAANSYILPDTARTLTTVWDEGFPRHVTSGQDTTLTWEWKHADRLRMGKYVAKAVLVYHDGQRDVPLVASHTFWVIPWKLLLVSVIVGGLIITGLIAWIRAVVKGGKKVGKKYARQK